MTLSRREGGADAAIGRPVPLEGARAHVTGQGSFLGDVPARGDELCVALVTSPVAHGLITHLDVRRARAVPGVVRILTHADLPGARAFGPLLADEPFLPHDVVSYVGQPVVVLAGEHDEAVRAAAAMVELEVAPLPAVLTMADARARDAYLSEERVIRRGDAAAALAAAPYRRRGVFHSLGQEHLYFEPQISIVTPSEDGMLRVQASTQGPSETQHVVASACGLGLHAVICDASRLGGGFGGKETQANLPAALAGLVAHSTRRPARLEYSRREDLARTGKRHAFEAHWDVGFDETGRIHGYRVHFYADGGAFTDLSPSVLDRAMLHADNAYFLEHVEIRGRVCATHRAPATAFRGFGGPQGAAAMECVIEAVRRALLEEGVTLNGTALRRRNLYVAGRDTTPYGQQIPGNHLPAIVEQAARTSDVETRWSQMQQENATAVAVGGRWLRGVALTPVKFGISFVARFMNQANALVQVYPDGTVQVSTGGVEMGQGLHTKIQQIVADVFAIDLSAVRVLPTSTEKNHNTSPTAASASTDLNGAAAHDASCTIRTRLIEWLAGEWRCAPDELVLRDGAVQHASTGQRMPFADACAGARLARIDLGARGFYATPGLDFDRERGEGTPFRYFTQGAAVSEVRVDRRTGGVEVLRADLLIDIGRSINPGIDRGQVIGGFMQGLGWTTTECLVYDRHGRLLTDSTDTYKIPSLRDVPESFACAFFESDGPAETIARSKGVGEPPLLLALSVWCAVADALTAVGGSAAARLCLPATDEEVLRALSLAHEPLNPDAWQHSAMHLLAGES